MRKFASITGGCLLAVWAGCSHQVVSPPARMLALESAGPARPGETVVGARSGVYASVFDPGAAVATAGVRRGIREGVEVNGEATYAHVVEGGYPEIPRGLYVGRLGAKLGGRHLAATVGAGGGYSPAAGGFTAIDAGGIVSYDNCYAVPFLAPSLVLSVPVNPRTVDFSEGVTSTAHTSYGGGVAAGFEISLQRQRCREGRTAPRLQLGLNFVYLANSEGNVTRVINNRTETTGGNYAAIGLAAGVEFPF